MRYIYIVLFGLLLSFLASCQKDIDGGVGNREVSTITFNATFGGSEQGVSSSVQTRATSTAFEDGDRVGVYVTKGDLGLRGSLNALDNKLFAYFVAGDSLSGVPTSAFYPDKTTPVAMYAYYPFTASVVSAFSLPFRVTNDIKASDLCYASLPKQSPSKDPLKLTFRHSLARLMVNVDFNAISSQVESIKSITVRSVRDSCYLNLNDGTIRVSSNSINDITASTDGVFILPAQSLTTSRLIDVVCKTRGSGEDVTLSYYSNGATPLQLEQGYSYTINLIAADNKSLYLSDRTIIEPWLESATSSTLNQSANNHFTLHWLLPNNRYGQTTGATLFIRNAYNGLLSPYKVSNFTAAAGNDILKASFTFDLADHNLGYPYSIESIAFLTASGDTVQNCKSIVAAVVYRRGDLTVGVKQDNILTITTGTIGSWNSENLGGIITGGGVANAFNLTMYEPLAFNPSLDYSSIKSVTLIIDNASYTFSGSKVKLDPSSNALIAIVRFELPDDNGKTPIMYPYTIEAITLKNASSTSIYNGYCDIAVSSGASVSINLYKGGKIDVSTTGNIAAWGTATVPAGEVIYTGPLSSNPLAVVYCNGSATAASECTSLSKIELTTSAGAMTLSGYSMTGTRFAGTSATSIDISTATGPKPTNYPFAITKVRFLKLDGTQLENIVPATPIWVYQSGQVQFQVMK